MRYTDDPVRDWDTYMEEQEKYYEQKEWEEEQWRRADIAYEEQKINEEDE